MVGMIIRTEHLSRSFGTVKAVDDLNLEVPPGIIFGFLGPNGAGKTTTIHLLLGLIPPMQGQASVLGLDVGKVKQALCAAHGPPHSLFLHLDDTSAFPRSEGTPHPRTKTAGRTPITSIFDV